ncbi:MAG: hypothetical protein KJO56_03160 [Gammaproteobacteria bacterium]|nr:hypothetical protein [Gammaproteobacteria bacterium]
MRIRHIHCSSALVLILVMSKLSFAADLPDSFPGDVPVADFMEVTSVSQVRDDLMVDFHAPGQAMDSVAEWVIAGMTDAGWKSTGDSGSSRNRILAFEKGDRRCGVMITNFVMSPSMQIDESIKGVQYQISGGSDAGQEATSVSSEAITADEAK